MNNFDKGKKVGGRLGLMCVLIGLVIANMLWTGLIVIEGVTFTEALSWYIEFWLNLLVGIGGVLLAGYSFGKQAGIEILVKKRNKYFAGIKCGVLTMWAGTLSGSAVEFVKSFRPGHSLSYLAYDYIFKPLYWVSLFGIIPVIMIGIWFGSKIESAKESFSK